MNTTPNSAATRILPPGALAAMQCAEEPATAEELAAVRRLIVAGRGDTGQARRVTNFLLSWWNSITCVGFDLTDLWSLDAPLVQDVLAVASMVARVRCYPDELGFGEAFDDLVALHRPGMA